MIYRIDVTAMAVADLDAIDEDLTKISPDVAGRTRSLLERAMALLEVFPNRYALAPEAFVHGKTLRQLIVGHYRVVYMVYAESVSIVRVRHVAQAPLKADELN